MSLTMKQQAGKCVVKPPSRYIALLALERSRARRMEQDSKDYRAMIETLLCYIDDIRATVDKETICSLEDWDLLKEDGDTTQTDSDSDE